MTPCNFLSLKPLTAIANENLEQISLNHVNRWQFLQKLHADFWSRWRNEYLH